MPFGLTIGTERAAALQQAIQDELMKRGYSVDADPVMAEYITIMIINNKTAEQITSEMDDLIGSDFDPSFTSWLFAEAEKGAAEPAPAPAEPAAAPSKPAFQRDPPPHIANEPPRKPLPSKNGVYQQALSQALPSGSTGQKRTASARSPSPNGPNKVRRMDLPTGPRAMQRDGASSGPSSRSLIERMGGHAQPSKQDDIQARIDNITNSSPDPSMMMGGVFPGVGGMPPGMDMNAMNAAAMSNPIMLQEIMMNQMALMAQITGMMGPGQFPGGPGFPMQNPGDMNGYNGHHHQNGRGRGRGRGSGRWGRGGHSGGGGNSSEDTNKDAEPPKVQQGPETKATPPTPAIVAPTPTPAPPSRPGFVVPERPQSPTLCKFNTKCTNANCRYSHASPVATTESGIVLSNDPCENGKDCKDPDCIKAHVSPAVLNPEAVKQSSIPTNVAPPTTYHTPAPAVVACRFGNACTRPNCPYQHPSPAAANNHFAQPCRFGGGCTRADCKFQHPEGRTLPSTFHRGLAPSSPMVNVATPDTGSIGPSPHKSVVFNSQNIKEKLAKLEEEKNLAQKAMKAAQDAAKKKGGSNPVPITA